MSNFLKKKQTHCKRGHEFTIENTYWETHGKYKTRKCKECRLLIQREWIKNNRTYNNKRARDYRKIWEQKKRIECLTYYGDGKLSCICCGESVYQFLTLGHINDNGQEERKLYGNQMNIILRLIKLGFPEGYETVCWNCNLGKRSNKGICPHKIRSRVPVELKTIKFNGIEM